MVILVRDDNGWDQGADNAEREDTEKCSDSGDTHTHTTAFCVLHITVKN